MIITLRPKIQYGALRRELLLGEKLVRAGGYLGLSLELGRNALRYTEANKAERMAQGQWGYVERRDDGIPRTRPYAVAHLMVYFWPFEFHAWMNNEGSLGAYWVLRWRGERYTFLSPMRVTDRSRPEGKWYYSPWIKSERP